MDLVATRTGGTLAAGGHPSLSTTDQYPVPISGHCGVAAAFFSNLSDFSADFHNEG